MMTDVMFTQFFSADRFFSTNLKYDHYFKGLSTECTIFRITVADNIFDREPQIWVL